ncbi:MAG: hypothetical protein H6855_04485 [Rhodospirillales bacterium]|nr:hypothetical protein [Rhodospirillales bacterium]MCB9973163.1 hypothetical protein [Rhodospirillales bacterium]MCB9980155.1 hypothetical protein [Rhodospirillales bacterium]
MAIFTTMMYHTEKTALLGQLQASLFAFSAPTSERVDTQDALLILSGLLVETLLLFEEPEQGLVHTLHMIAKRLDMTKDLDQHASILAPHPCILDCQAEQGRLLAREIFEDWLECSHEFRSFIETFTAQSLLLWERDGLSRGSLYNTLFEMTVRYMAFEVAAQELCDVVIEEMIGGWGWTVQDAVVGLSALAGHKLAQSLESDKCMLFFGADIPDHLDSIVHIMTQEAVRYGTPAGSDWRFGLAANDLPPNPPWEMMCSVESYAEKLLSCLPLRDLQDHAAACAKAAGRMIAVASGGEEPEFEPAIIKPLAMAAISESYKGVCLKLRAQA